MKEVFYEKESFSNIDQCHDAHCGAGWMRGISRDSGTGTGK